MRVLTTYLLVGTRDEAVMANEAVVANEALKELLANELEATFVGVAGVGAQDADVEKDAVKALDADVANEDEMRT